MFVIQRLPENRFKLICILLIGLSVAARANPSVPIAFSPEKIQLSNGRHFYLAEIRDARKNPGGEIGTVIGPSGPGSIGFEAPLHTVLRNFWGPSALKTDGAAEQIPLILTVNRYALSEKRNGPRSVSGQFDISLSLGWIRDGEMVRLNDLNAGVSYTRGIEAAYSHSRLVQKITADALRNIDKWFGANEGKNPGLVRRTKLTFPDKVFRETADTVFYSFDRKLNWSDFKARPSVRGQYAATVFASFGYEVDAKVNGNVLVLAIHVKVYTVKSMSWVLPEAKNDYTLAHEQTHFDIAKIAAENFRQQVAAEGLSVDDYDSEIQYRFIEAYRAMHDEQKRYDDQTNHGLNRAAQARWQEKVARQLLALQPQ